MAYRIQDIDTLDDDFQHEDDWSDFEEIDDYYNDDWWEAEHKKMIERDRITMVRWFLCK